MEEAREREECLRGRVGVRTLLGFPEEGVTESVLCRGRVLVVTTLSSYCAYLIRGWCFLYTGRWYRLLMGVETQ